MVSLSVTIEMGSLDIPGVTAILAKADFLILELRLFVSS